MSKIDAFVLAEPSNIFVLFMMDVAALMGLTASILPLV